MYLLVHTMTIRQHGGVVMKAQFYHMVKDNVANVKLIGRRFSIRVPNRNHAGKAFAGKFHLERLSAVDLRTLLKQRSTHVQHHFRTVQISNSVRPNLLQNQLMVQKLNESDPRLINVNQQASNLQNVVINDQPQVDTSVKDCIPNTPLLPEADYQQTVKWLTINRFGNYLQTFASFSGADMLRMSKEDFIEICGLPDGIRLYNALHSKAITPKLTLYVCRENAQVFQAIYLMAFNDMEFSQKLSNFVRVPRDQVGDFYIEGPQGIHVLVNEDVLTHIKDESMFSVDIVQHSNRYVVVLKPISSK